MQFFIGVDGGGSGCRAQAELVDGRKTRLLSGGPANMFSAPETAISEVRALLNRITAEAQLLADCTDTPEPVIVLGLAGVTESDSTARLQGALPFERVTVTGDVEIAVSGAFADNDGIVAAIGTGSVFARQRSGLIERMGGYGLDLGDEASGAWIGREALRRALHARDGIAPKTALVAAVWQHFGTLSEMLCFARTARPADLATLAPLVLAQDQQHCPIAGAILDDACAYVQKVVSHLQAGATETPVTAMGSLAPAILDRLAAQGGTCLQQITPRGSAVEGALWQARKIAQKEP